MARLCHLRVEKIFVLIRYVQVLGAFTRYQLRRRNDNMMTSLPLPWHSLVIIVNIRSAAIVIVAGYSVEMG